VTLRAWATSDTYWDARFDMLKRVKNAFQAGGLMTPYPHQITVEKTSKAATETPPASAAESGDTSGANPSASAPSQGPS
jgi:small-conductance mechanosensitive channel